MRKRKDTVTQDQLDLMIVEMMEEHVRVQQQFTVEEIYRYVQELCHKRGIVFAKLDNGSTELITNRSYIETSIQNAIDLLCEAGLLEASTS